MRLTLKNKMLVLITVVALLPLAVTLGLTIQFRQAVADEAGREMQGMARSSLTQTARDLYGLFETTNELVQARANQNLENARELLARRGGLRLGRDTVTWQAVQQDSRETQIVRLPRVMAGDTWLGENRLAGTPTPFVDDVEHQPGDTFSVFERMNEAGDMVRVATNEHTSSGERAIGGYLAANDAAVSTVLRGRTYRGVAFFSGSTHMAACEPAREGGRVFGMLCASVRLDAIDAVRKTVLATRIGKNGYVVVIRCKGGDRGRYVFSKDGQRDGESIWDAKDGEGRPIIQNTIAKALSMQSGEIFHDTYLWSNGPDALRARKTAALVYFAPWDWLINAGVEDQEYSGAIQTVRSGITSLLWQITGAGLVTLVLSLVLARYMGGRLVKPLEAASMAAQHIAAGDVEEARRDLLVAGQDGAGRNGMTADESTELLHALDTMSGGLDSLLGQVQRSGIQVNAAAVEIAASARQSEAAVAEQAAATREVSATSKEISATSVDLLRTMQDVGSAVTHAGEQAQQGHADLTRMSAAIDELVRSTSSICAKLGVISERASKISSVVTTINKISDQTGLLALNAAIEAEKAGEYGRGFSVVAREISRLADQTAAATGDIEGVVRDMQSSVSGGVMEMDKFSDEVRRRAQEVSTIGRQLAGVIEGVEHLGPQFDALREGMQAQTQGAQQISEAMTQLSQSADQSRQALREFKSATEQLNSAVQGLQGAVAGFRTTVRQ